MIEDVDVAIVRLAHGKHLDLPAYATNFAAGMDLMAAVEREVVLEPGARSLIPTGVAIAIPPGYEAQVRPRSGLAARHGVTVLNSPGTIDADYRGEIKVILVNLGQDRFIVEPNARIAQLILASVSRIVWRPAETLPETARGDGGFGSTGIGKIGA
jgi:dUTP pyrophosphatase